MASAILDGCSCFGWKSAPPIEGADIESGVTFRPQLAIDFGLSARHAIPTVGRFDPDGNEQDS